MTYALFSWLVISLILGASAYFAIWARTGAHKPRFLSLVAFFGGSLIAAVAIVFSMGWSSPCISYITAPGNAKYKIIHATFEPEVRINLFIEIPGKGPKVCYIPWSAGKAQEIIEGLQTLEGTELQFGGIDGIFSEEGEPQLWAPPPTANGPPKQAEPPQYNFDDL